MKGLCQRGNALYRRFKVKRDGRWVDHYVKLPPLDHPSFAAKWAEANKNAPRRDKPLEGTMAALIALYRPILTERRLAQATRRNWIYYLDLIEQQHGKRIVADLTRGHCYRIRDAMMETPGKADNYMSKLKALLEFACEREIIRENPAKGIPLLGNDEHQPWPPHVIQDVLEAADGMLRLAVVSGLCSGQRVSDVIRMEHGWHNGRMMELRSQKTDTPAIIPMHPIWLKAIKDVEPKTRTLLYDRFGKPFTGTDRIQERIRRIMHKLGHVDDAGQLLYTFHGLSKNAICYLTVLGLDENTIEAIVGKTPQTIRHYAKHAKRWMLAHGAADRVIGGEIEGLVGSRANLVGKLVADA